MFKSKKFMVIVVVAFMAICLLGGTVVAYAVSANDKGNPGVAVQGNKGNGDIYEQEDDALTAEKQKNKNDIPLNADGTPAASGGRGSRLQAIENAGVVIGSEDTAAQNAKGNGNINEQEDEALTAEKQKNKDDIPLNADGTPAAPGGRGSRLR